MSGNPPSNNPPSINPPPKKPREPEHKPDDALQRQIDDRKRAEHDKHLNQYRQPNPRAIWGS